MMICHTFSFSFFRIKESTWINDKSLDSWINGRENHVNEKNFIPQKPVNVTKNEPIYIGFIMRHVDTYSESSGKFKTQFVTFIRSIFKNLERFDRDIHFIVLTDIASCPHVHKLLEKFIQKDVYDKVNGDQIFN